MNEVSAAKIEKAFVMPAGDNEYHVYYLVTGVSNKNECRNVFRAWAQENGSLGRCDCAHDCCGHWFVSSWDVVHVNQTCNYALVCVEGAQNV